MSKKKRAVKCGHLQNKFILQIYREDDNVIMNYNAQPLKKKTCNIKKNFKRISNLANKTQKQEEESKVRK